MEHKAFLSSWCRTFMHTKKKNVFFLNALMISFSLTSPTRKTIPCGVCENSHAFRESRCYEINVCTRRLTHLFFFDDGAIFGENFVFVRGLVLKTISLSVSQSFSPSIVRMSSSKPTGVGRVNFLYQEPIVEDYDCPFLGDCNRKESEQCDSEVEGEDDGWHGTENQWCLLLDFLYHYFIGPRLLRFMKNWTYRENQQLVSLFLLLPL